MRLHDQGASAPSHTDGFEVGWRDAGGEHRVPLFEFSGVEFEAGLPVRGFPSYRGQRHFPGLYWSATTGGHVGFESWLERDHVMLLDFTPEVTGLLSQPFWLFWENERGKQVSHAPDYFARFEDGRGLMVDCRPLDRIDARTAVKFAATQAACASAGWGYRVVGEVDAVRMANVRWLTGYRHPRHGVAEGLVEQLVRRRSPGTGPALPVVFVTVPPAATPKILAGEFARFLGIPLHYRMSQVQITNAVCDLLGSLGTVLVLVDEIHNLDLTTRSGAEASDQLKYLTERIAATFVLAGLNVETGTLFQGVRGQQIAGRYSVVASKAFGRRSRADREQWQALIATMESSLRLDRHKPGTLLALDAYLHDRTSGLIGSLSQLIREAAITAIDTGSEKITKRSLESVELDHTAQQSQPKPPSGRTGRKPKAA
ncbi:TnsA-like heteromeric transposase endonuclease subunit [Streptomyces sp. NPDC057757]|uniref:TnsA-like heteromeric transposase endonuclease subunit n=1 Tax=Streptomyces sp. NPDC057757 TaxID=3346241 RepID=UPI0036CF47DA